MKLHVGSIAVPRPTETTPNPAMSPQTNITPTVLHTALETWVQANQDNIPSRNWKVNAYNWQTASCVGNGITSLRNEVWTIFIDTNSNKYVIHVRLPSDNLFILHDTTLEISTFLNDRYPPN
jgi:hypothetical protein